MDRRTYKALRRCLWATKISELCDGLYGLRMRQGEDEAFDQMLGDEDNVIYYTAQELLDELDAEEEDE